MTFRARIVARWTAPIVVGALVLAACGGGGGGGGGGGSAATAFTMTGVPSFGATAPMPLLQAFNVSTPTAATQVGPNDFPAAQPGQRNFLQFQFTSDIDAPTITGTGIPGSAGIALQRADGSQIGYSLDTTGTIDPTNAFPAPGVAPALLRIYVEEPILFAGAPNQLPPDQYIVVVEPTRLRSSTGQQLCVQRGANNACVQSPRIRYSFTVGGDVLPPTGATTGAFEPIVGSTIARDAEIRVFFSENIDFQSIIGSQGQGPNSTQRDQFISRVFPVNNLAMNMTPFGENVVVQYTAPPGTALPANYGFVVYMPDPFHNPTEVRIRFVNAQSLVSNDTFPNVQNYGLDSRVYTSAGFTPPVNGNGQTLTLPPALPLPGSTPTGNATLTIVFGSSGAAFATDASSNGDTIAGVTDRQRLALVADVTVQPQYTIQQGPPVNNNPSPPDVTFITNANQITAISGGKMTNTSTPVAAGGQVTGLLNVLPVNLNDSSILSQAGDIEFGQFVNQTSGLNLVHNAPRRLQIPPPINDNNGDPAIPFPQGGTPEFNLLPLLGIMAGPPVPPLGVFLYVVDNATHEVKVFESNTMTLLTTLAGVPSPGGVGIAPNISFLYVSNFDQGTLSKIGANQFQTTTFHQIVSTISVGTNPRAVTVHVGNEDVLVVNTGENSLSFVDVPSQLERIKVPVGSGPRDVWTTSRFNCMGCTLAYMAYVPNFFANSLSVYESDSPLLTVNNGPDGKIIDTLGGLSGPSGGCWNRRSLIVFAPFMGCYVASSLGTTVEERSAIAFGLSPVPGFQGPPGFRTFGTTAVFATNQIVGSPGDAVVENLSALGLDITDNKSFSDADFAPNPGVPSVLMVSYPAAGQVAAYDLTSGAFFGSVAVPGTLMYSYYDQ
jgi:hypothetical protein